MGVESGHERPSVLPAGKLPGLLRPKVMQLQNPSWHLHAPDIDFRRALQNPDPLPVTRIDVQNRRTTHQRGRSISRRHYGDDLTGNAAHRSDFASLASERRWSRLARGSFPSVVNAFGPYRSTTSRFARSSRKRLSAPVASKRERL